MEFIELKKDQLNEPVKAIREGMKEKEFVALRDSIKENGIIEPLIVKKSGDRYEVVCGHRRLIAGMDAEVEFFPCIVREFSDVDALIEKYHENSFREDLTTHEEATLFNQLKTMKGLSVEKIAIQMNRTQHYIKARLELLTFPDYLIDAVKKEIVTLSIAQELSFITSRTSQMTLLRQAELQKASLDRVRQWVGGWLKNNNLALYEKREDVYGKAGNPNPKIPCNTCRGETRLSDLKHLQVCPGCFEVMMDLVNTTLTKIQENENENEDAPPETPA